MGAELFHVDGRTDMTKLIVAFRNFANAPKKKTTHMTLYKEIIAVCFYSHTKYTLWAELEKEFFSFNLNPLVDKLTTGLLKG